MSHSPQSLPSQTEVIHYQFYDASHRDRFHLSQITLAALKHAGLGKILSQKSYSKGLISCLDIERERFETSLRSELEGKLEQGANWEETEIIRMVGNVAETMLYAEKQGVLCAELRPENIALDGNRYKLQGLVQSNVVEIPEVTMASLSPERREMMNGEQRPDTDLSKSAVYSLGTISVWLLVPATWGLIQSPETLQTALSTISIGEKCRSLLAAMIQRNSSERPDWSQILDYLSLKTPPISEIQSCLNAEKYDQLADYLAQFWSYISISISIPCEFCKEETVLPSTSTCPRHVLCDACASTGKCPVCPVQRRKVIVKAKPRPSETVICKTCGGSFNVSSSESWRLNYVGSTVEAKEYCSERCVPPPNPEAEIPSSSRFSLSLEAVPLQDQQIQMLHWKTYTLEEKQAKAAEVIRKWHLNLDIPTAIHALELTLQQSETKRKENSALLNFTCEMLEQFNEGMKCHFCGRFMEELLEVRWLVCSGTPRAICTENCFRATLGTEVLSAFADCGCPGCRGELEGRRLAETVTFTAVSEFPACDPWTDCYLCYRLGEYQLPCGHYYCQSCPNDEICKFCEEQQVYR